MRGRWPVPVRAPMKPGPRINPVSRALSAPSAGFLTCPLTPTPILAGIVNRAGSFAASSNAELTSIYADKALTADYTDITAAYCGPYQGLATGTGWDLCTGVGVVKGYAGK